MEVDFEVPLVSSGATHHEIDGVLVKCGSIGECVFCGIESMVSYSQNQLLGGVLTVVDATITESKQNKAVKDLIKSKVYQELVELRIQLRQAVWNTKNYTAKMTAEPLMVVKP